MERYAELGYGLDPRPPPRLPFPPLYGPIQERRPVDGAYAPLSCARWRWSGHPNLFDVLDLDKNEVVDEIEIADGLGRAGIALLYGDTAGPLSADALGRQPRRVPAHRRQQGRPREPGRASSGRSALTPSASRTAIQRTARRYPRARSTSGARTRAA